MKYTATIIYNDIFVIELQGTNKRALERSARKLLREKAIVTRKGSVFGRCLEDPDNRYHIYDNEGEPVEALPNALGCDRSGNLCWFDY